MPDQEEPMATAAVARFYGVYHEGRVELLDELLAPDYVGQVNGREIVGVEAAKGFVQSFLAAFPDVRYTVHDRVAGDGKVVARWSATATHRGIFAGVEQTQKRVTMLGMTIFAVSEGKIHSLWSTWDVFGLLQQLQR